MTSPRFEALLAKIYTDEAARSRFLADPATYGRAAGLNEAECAALQAIDQTGLEMTANSLARKKLKRRK
jgi:hypothetical protein